MGSVTATARAAVRSICQAGWRSSGCRHVREENRGSSGWVSGCFAPAPTTGRGVGRPAHGLPRPRDPRRAGGRRSLRRQGQHLEGIPLRRSP